MHKVLLRDAHEDGSLNKFHPSMHSDNHIAIGAEAVPQRPKVATLGRSRQCLLDELRCMVLRGVRPRKDGLEIDANAESLELAEHLLLSLSEDIELPHVGIADDGEITFEWYKVDKGDKWSGGLAVAPYLEVEGYVIGGPQDRTEASFLVKRGDMNMCLPDELVASLQRHWGAHARKANN